MRQRQEQARARPRSVYGWSGFDPYAFGYEDEEDLDEEEEQYQPEWTPFGYRPSQAPALRRRVRSDMDEVPEPRFYRQPTSPKRQERSPSPVIDEKVSTSFRVVILLFLNVVLIVFSGTECLNSCIFPTSSHANSTIPRTNRCGNNHSNCLPFTPPASQRSPVNLPNHL